MGLLLAGRIIADPGPGPGQLDGASAIWYDTGR